MTQHLRALVVLLTLFLTTGCALFTKPADTVTFQRGGFYMAYRDLSVTYALTRAKIEAGCKAGKLEATWCQHDVARIHEEMLHVDRQIMQALVNPAAEIDWEAVARAVKLVASLVGAAL